MVPLIDYGFVSDGVDRSRLCRDERLSHFVAGNTAWTLVVFSLLRWSCRDLLERQRRTAHACLAPGGIRSELV